MFDAAANLHYVFDVSKRQDLLEHISFIIKFDKKFLNCGVQNDFAAYEMKRLLRQLPWHHGNRHLITDCNNLNDNCAYKH